VVESRGIQLDRVSFRIGEFAIEELSVTIRQGEYFVMTGPNGSGKTVLVRLIAGLYRPISGAIRIDGRSVADLPPWRRGIGYVPQEGVLFPNRTVHGNIAFGLEVRGRPKKAIGAEVERAASMMGIQHLLQRRTHGLSGGERQRVSLARALVFQPALLLLDEPVSAIDEGSRDDVCRLLRDMQQRFGVTTVHVSHNRRETDLVADRVGFLVDGRLGRTVEQDRNGKGAS